MAVLILESLKGKYARHFSTILNGDIDDILANPDEHIPPNPHREGGLSWMTYEEERRAVMDEIRSLLGEEIDAEVIE